MKTMISTLSLLLACATVNLNGVHMDELKGMQRLDCALIPYPTDHPQIDLQGKDDAVPIPEWAGYTAATNFSDLSPESVSKVSGSWTVPTLNTAGAVSIWTRIKGCELNNIQVGTSHFFQDSEQIDFGCLDIGFDSYYLPEFPISQGDLIAADLTYIGDDKFCPILINYTQNAYYSGSDLVSGCELMCTSAEWVVDRSFWGADFWPLAEFDKITFTNCSSTINSVEGPIYHTPYDVITMAYNYGSRAIPSTLSEDGSSFNVIYDRP